ncbi:PREDICTED: uncharacterized protein C1orf101-like isoform X1 [Acropora digitifera]|uniref:uncharacterized protein C1orf101-like isoform X1 n=1 Tax=Acropora digitifera TaxID=70779 RepID=UPI00077AF36D|nr:PREDICTED: uncharacterized protein C1orf101-like isoform X1 [Acropora digitifera]XP_015780060.1 PREDICTED: uncharacterized protein C1orf101-like isoform X1 [Acropora digitifera]XP_015780061.1 PREDICTED: uncharacterized protein C1orf101-like isoform X1 [Acropora digitifera]
MKEAGCIREAQSYELMIKSMQRTNKEAAWSKQNFRSCFEDPPSESVIPDNLNQAYEIMNSSSVSHIVWTDDGIFIFTLTVIDPEFSFCNLTVEFAVQVICARSLFQELPPLLLPWDPVVLPSQLWFSPRTISRRSSRHDSVAFDI